MSQPGQRHTQSFIVRFWSESADSNSGQITGQVERVGSGEKAHFLGAMGLLKLLERWTPNFKISEQQLKEEEQ